MGAEFEKKTKFVVTSPSFIISQLKHQKAIFCGFLKERSVSIGKPKWKYTQEGLYFELVSGFKKKIILKNEKFTHSDIESDKMIEIEVNDLQRCQELFSLIGFTESLKMESYRMFWEKGDLSISIDELPFGVYLNLKGSIHSIRVFSSLLNYDFADAINKNYWELSMEKYNSSTPRDVLFPEGHISVLSN